MERVREIEWEISLEKLRQSEYYKNLLAGLKEGTAEYEEALRLQNELVDALRRLHDAHWDVEKAGARTWETIGAAARLYGSQVSQLINLAGQMYAQSVRRETDALRRELRERHAMLRQALADEMQERFHAKGFVEAATKAQHKEELRLAKESGDQQRIFQAHSSKERFLIEEEFAQKKYELDAETAKKEAQLSYRAAAAQWKAQLLSAKVSAAQAVLAASVNMWPVPAIPMMALAGGVGAAQIGLVKMNRPKMQSFDSGGIVPGNSFRGDNIIARVNSGEMILNMRQQRNLFNAIDRNELGGGSQPTVANIIFRIDGRDIAKKTIELVNNRTYLIDARSIK